MCTHAILVKSEIEISGQIMLHHESYKTAWDCLVRKIVLLSVCFVLLFSIVLRQLCGVPPEKTITSANSLKTLQDGLKHRETPKNTTGKQGKSGLFTEH